MKAIPSIVLNAALIATVLWIAAFGAVWALRRGSASLRRAVWVVAIVSALLLPAVVITAPRWTKPAILLAVPDVRELAPAALGPAPPSATPRAVHSALSTADWVGMLWLAGFLVVLSRLGTGVQRIARLAREATLIAPPEALTGLYRQTGVRRNVRVVESARVWMPLAWGVSRPTVLLPSTFREWPAERLRLALAHELVHIRRHDCLLQLLSQAACALYWFHPLAWYGAARLRQERECACDDAVLDLGVPGPEYAEHLVALIRSLKPVGAVPSFAVAMAQHSQIEGRLIALLDARRNRKPASARAVLAAVAAACCLTLPLSLLRAQAPASSGTIRGTVTDISGAVVPGATILASNLDANTMETAKADAAGNYALTGIPSGRYSIEITKPGFKRFQSAEVALGPNDNSRFDVVLQIGAMNETVDVVGKAPQSAQPAMAPAGVPKRIRVGGNVQAARLLSSSPPVYPETAREKGIQGPVLLRAVVSMQGDVLSMQVLNTTNPDLAQAAQDAVSHWRYEPTLLNGKPVEVVTTITVNFRLEP